jgi:hypothetical protein
MIDKPNEQTSALTRRVPSAGSRSVALRSLPLLVAAILMSTSISGREPYSAAPAAGAPQSGSGAAGTFDIAEVEDLALFFAVESVRRLRVPLAMRLLTLGKSPLNKQEEIETIRSNPPRADTQGVVYPFGDKNALSFVYNSAARSLSCWERVVKKRGSTGNFARTGPEMAVARNTASSRERDRGGADFAYDPIRDAVSLRRDYLHPPADRDRFYKELSRLLATELKWEKGRYLEKAVAIAESLHPPGSATAAADGFQATLVLRHFSAEPAQAKHWVERYVRAWDRPPGVRPPLLVSDRELLVDQTFNAYIHFRGARDGAHGTAAVDATFRLVGADGTEIFTDLQVPIWRTEAPPSDHLQLGVNDLSFSIDEEEPTGNHRLEAQVCDTATSRCVQLAHPFVLRSR